MSRLLFCAALLALAACNGGGGADGGDGASPGDLGGELGASDMSMDAPHTDLGPPCDDLDSDGHGARSCGGDDCDDADANRYPGNLEICDALGIDEDCDPSTLGPDADGDHAAYIGCCNVQPDTMLTCGTDCDDSRATVGPTAIESCDGIDDDCDGMIDEGVITTYCTDNDGDGHGSLAGAVSACGAPPGTTTVCNDCIDFDPTEYPGATETCNGYDDDCDFAIDEGCSCAPDGITQGCGFDAGGCRAGVQTCIGGVWEATCAGATTPMIEVCNGVDDDCDYATDEGVTFTFYPDCDGDGFGVDARSVIRCTRPSGVPPGCPRGLWTETGGDCDDTDAARTPGAGCDVDAGVDAGVDSGVMPPSPNVTSIAVGDGTICGLLSDGTVACFGANDVGQHGDGHLTTDPMMAESTFVLGLADAVEVAFGGGASGTGHGCARRTDGTVVCWGSSSHGELGYGGYGLRSTFVAVPGITDARQIVAGYQHTCALHADHTVSCWGAGSSGQLGNGSTDDAPLPDVVFGLTDAVELSAGDYHTCARRSSGGIDCWGNDFYGQLGDGATVNRSTPTPVVGLVGTPNSLSAGGTFTCAVTTATISTLECWGGNAHGQIAQGATSPRVLAPSMPIILHGSPSRVALGAATACVLYADTTVDCWGDGSNGARAEVTGGDAASPMPIGGTLMAYTAIWASAQNTCVIAATGAWCWGSNNAGQIGGYPGDPATAPAYMSFYSPP